MTDFIEYVYEAFGVPYDGSTPDAEDFADFIQDNCDETTDASESILMYLDEFMEQSGYDDTDVPNFVSEVVSYLDA